MSAASTHSERLRAERQEEWRSLEEIVARAESKSVRALSDEELLALPILYRGALSSLSIARETSIDKDLIAYLEGLSTRAYFFVYGVRTSLGDRLKGFFARDWPGAVRSLRFETLASLLFMLTGVAVGWVLVTGDPEWFDAFVPAQLAQGRNFGADVAVLRDTLYHDGGAGGLGFFATLLFTHNSQVAILCFALGFALGIPTAMLLVYNGTMLGAMLALFAERGLGVEFAGWLIIHGSTELFAIVLAGAAGLRIGYAMIAPGELPRLAALTQAGRAATLAMAGVVVMLLFAGLLEGYGRQLVTNDAARYAIGAAMLMLWLAYFYLPRRTRP